MSGYCGYSKSNRAITAEKRGLLPLSRAVAELNKILGITRSQAREALIHIGPVEWHHTSKFYNKTEYYDIAAARRYIKARTEVTRLPKDWRAIMEETRSLASNDVDRLGRIDLADQALADAAGICKTTMINEYYNDWNDHDEMGN